MPTWIKIFLGACFGAGFGYLYGKHVAEEACLDEIEELEEKIRELREETEGREGRKGRSRRYDALTEPYKARRDMQETVQEGMVTDKDKARREALESENGHSGEGLPEQIYEIFGRDWGSTNSHYHKLNYTIYLVDKVVIDENDQVVDKSDWHEFLTPFSTSESVFGLLDEPGAVAYVRNEKLQKDFAIESVAMSYRETFFGEYDDPRLYEDRDDPGPYEY